MKKRINKFTEKAMKNIGIVVVSIIVLIGAAAILNATMDWLICNTDVFYEVYNSSMLLEYTVGGLSTLVAYRTLKSLRKVTFSR